MRKLLLTSSALVAVASISSYAVADVSVTGGFAFYYTQQAADQTTKDGTTDTDTTNMGVQVSMGAMTLIASSGTKEIAGDDDIEGNGFGIKYDMGGGMTIAAATVEVTDELDKSGAEEEKYTANIGEVVYTVAPGLDAKVTYTDYEYKDGGSTTAGDDSGQITNLTITAAF